MKIHLSTLTHAVAKMAPLLGSALAGPQGTAVGQLIAAEWGGRLEQPDDLQDLIRRDPEAQVKLKQIEADHKVELQRLTLAAATEQLHETLQDRASARQREVTTASIPAAQRDRTPAVLAYLLTSGLFVVILALLVIPLPGENAHVIWGLVSSLATVWVGAMGYYHGSSLGASSRDTEFVHHLHYTPSWGDGEASPFSSAPPPPGMSV